MGVFIRKPRDESKLTRLTMAAAGLAASRSLFSVLQASTTLVKLSNGDGWGVLGAGVLVKDRRSWSLTMLSGDSLPWFFDFEKSALHLPGALVLIPAITPTTSSPTLTARLL